MSLVTQESNAASDATPVTSVTRNGAPLSNAERQRLYRERQKQKRAEARQNHSQNAPGSPTAANATDPTQITPSTDSGSNVIKINPHTDDKRSRKEAKAERRAELKAQADQAAREPAKPKVGAPTMYTSELGDEICLRLALREPLVKICADPHMPCETTVYVWRQKVPDFAANFARAREHRAEARADRIDQLVDMVTTGRLDPNAAKVAIDAEKWQAGKEQPKVYGEKVDITSAGKPLASASDLDIAKALAHALAVPALSAPTVIDAEAVPVDEENSS